MVLIFQISALYVVSPTIAPDTYKNTQVSLIFPAKLFTVNYKSCNISDLCRLSAAWSAGT